jgi:GAF domain-containing protein
MSVHQSLESLVEKRAEQIHTAAEIARMATSASDLDTILQRTVDLIVERFSYYHSGIHLIDPSGEKAILAKASGGLDAVNALSGLEVSVGSKSVIGWVAANNRSWVASDVHQDPYYMELDALPETRSEVGLPLSIGDKVLGVLDVQSTELNAFDEKDVATLQIIADQIASTLLNVQALEATQTDIQPTAMLYQASHEISAAENIDQVFSALAKTLHQIPLASALFRIGDDDSFVISAIDVRNENVDIVSNEIQITDQKHSRAFGNKPLIVADILDPPKNIPTPLFDLARRLGCGSLALLPMRTGDALIGLLLIGAPAKDSLPRDSFESVNSLVEISVTAIEKLSAIATMTQRLSELQSLNAISQSIATETELQRLYEILHHSIRQVMGSVNFLVALYDAGTNMIHVPYMDDGDGVISIPPFPLGQGLTSVIIRTRQPLMIVEDAENRSRELGAIVTGDKPAMSWLGVPLLVGREIIGVIVVQDLEEEYRFDDHDLRLLTTLSGQIASTIHNARLLTQTQEAAERDRLLYEIINKIRRTNDINTVMQITTEELSKTLNARRGHIEIAVDPLSLETGGNGSKGVREEVTE